MSDRVTLKEAVTFTATILRETVTEIGKNKQRE